MKLSSFAVNQVYSLLAGIATPRFKDCKPTKTDVPEYIVINALPVSGGRVQRCYVNVNCHAKDMGEGVPSRDKLDTMAYAVLDIIEKATTPTLLIDIESQELIREENLGEHYMNLRFSVRIRNI